MNKLFCFGYGYTASHLAANLRNQGYDVIGTSQTIKEGRILFNDLNPIEDFYTKYSDITHILISIPPNDKGDLILQHHKEALLKLPNLKWIGLLSTTGVYGNHNGAWVDENSETIPIDQRSKNRLLAENQWMSLFTEHNLPVHIFRLSEIYGPERNIITLVKDGKLGLIYKEGQYFSRMHIADIVRALEASIKDPKPANIYNLADDLPINTLDVRLYAYELLGITPPQIVPFEQAELSDMAKSFYASNKRVSNKKLKSLLLAELKYPTYKEGLLSLIHN